MDEKKLNFLKNYASHSNNKVYESLEKSVNSFIKINMPPPGAVNEMYKNWETILFLQNDMYFGRNYIVKNSYPKCIKKTRKGDAKLYIYAKNSSIASFFKNNSESIINNISFWFAKVIVNKIIVQTY